LPPGRSNNGMLKQCRRCHRPRGITGAAGTSNSVMFEAAKAGSLGDQCSTFDAAASVLSTVVSGRSRNTKTEEFEGRGKGFVFVAQSTFTVVGEGSGFCSGAHYAPVAGTQAIGGAPMGRGRNRTWCSSSYSNSQRYCTAASTGREPRCSRAWSRSGETFTR